MPPEGNGRAGYVIAGGMSSRMGMDKAGVCVGGRTLLETALAKLGEVCGKVAVVGGRRALPAEVRQIADRRAGCGPLAGVEAALGDAVQQGVAWAVFLPVDTPLVPAGLLRALVEVWMGDSRRRVGFAIGDGRAQPLIGAVHVAMLPLLTEALDRGERRLRPSLEEAGGRLAEGMGAAVGEVVLGVEVTTREGEVLLGGTPVRGWRPTASEWARRGWWWTNVNTPEDLASVEAQLVEEAGFPEAGDGRGASETRGVEY